MKKLQLMLAACALIVTPVLAQQPPATDGPVQQLRVYELFEPTRSAFHERFREHAIRIMRRYGFNIVAMWESRTEGRPEFVYLLDWPSESAMRTAWSGFMADREWIQIKAQYTERHGRVVGRIEDRTLRRMPAPPEQSAASAPQR
jgi:hypothetical protein